MGRKTEIAYCDSTWSPVRGCFFVSRGCENCYAERMAARFSWKGGTDADCSPENPCGQEPGGPYFGYAVMTPAGGRWTGRVELIESQLEIPLHWRKPRRIFVNSMSDSFHEALPDEAIDRIFAVMALCSGHTFMVLTKRAERMQKYFTQETSPYFYPCTRVDQEAQKILRRLHRDRDEMETEWPLPNVWLGVSVEDRASKHRIDLLRETPAALRFLSLEPLLEDLGELDLRGISLVIPGGESGPGARPCWVEWIRNVVEQCRMAGTACFVKQAGSNPMLDNKRLRLHNKKGGDLSELPLDLNVREFPNAICR